MEAPQKTTTTTTHFGLLSEVQDKIMDVQARLMDQCRSVLTMLRELKDLQFMLSMQQAAA